jgi:hypothetical protein
MERLWLDSGYAERDLMDIFARHATVGEKPHEEFDSDQVKVGWSENWGSETACKFHISTLGLTNTPIQTSP